MPEHKATYLWDLLRRHEGEGLAPEFGLDTVIAILEERSIYDLLDEFDQMKERVEELEKDTEAFERVLKKSYEVNKELIALVKETDAANNKLLAALEATKKKKTALQVVNNSRAKGKGSKS